MPRLSRFRLEFRVPLRSCPFSLRSTPPARWRGELGRWYSGIGLSGVLRCGTRVGSPVFPGFPSCSDAGFSDPATARHTSPVCGALVSSPVTPVTRHRPKFKDAMKRTRFRGSMSGFELTAYASCRPLGEHPSPSGSGVTTTQGSLPVERLHSLPPGLGPGWDSDETFLSIDVSSLSFRRFVEVPA
jgi:hypothetical protein